MSAEMTDLFGDSVSEASIPRAPLGDRKPSRKQAAILRYIKTSGAINLEQATDLVGQDVYHNERRYTGADTR